MDVSEAIRTMRAVRSFRDEPLPDDAIAAILNAGRRAQSSKNTQPWAFIAIRDRTTLAALAACGTFAGHLAGAALGVALVSSVENDYDIGQATAFMMLEAWNLGIGSCIAAMWEPDRAKEVLGIPADKRFWIAISFGYPAEQATLSRAPKRGGRQPLDEVVRWERWS